MFCKTLETHTESHMRCHWDLPAPLESRTNRAAAYFFASCLFLSSLGGLSSLQFTKQLCWGVSAGCSIACPRRASLCNIMNTYWITRNCNLLCKYVQMRAVNLEFRTSQAIETNSEQSRRHLTSKHESSQTLDLQHVL